MLPVGRKLRLRNLASICGVEPSDLEVVGTSEGGMGSVACVAHRPTGRRFALKTLLPEYLADSPSKRRFYNEIKLWIAASFSSGVVEAYCIEEVDGLPHVCADWLEGGNLRRLYDNRDPSTFFRTVARVTATLQMLHETLGLVHRDLKPENVLLDESDRPHLSDFGLSRVSLPRSGMRASEPARSDAGVPGRLSSAGEFFGTVLYASPEQILDSSKADLRSDIYSLGCLMFEWETGNVPADGDSIEQIADQKLNGPFPALSGWTHPTSFGVAHLVDWCLERDPANRPQSYGQFLRELRHVARIQGIEVPIDRPAERRVARPIPGAITPADQTRASGAYIDARTGYAIVELSFVNELLSEAHALMGVEEWTKALQVLLSTATTEMICALPGDPVHQCVVSNAAVCFNELGNPSEAKSGFQLIAAGEPWLAECYVNLSNAHLQLREFDEAVAVAKRGLVQYSEDPELIGNLLVALTSLRRLDEAFVVAKMRIAQGTDCAALSETGRLLCAMGLRERRRNWPEAVRRFRQAIVAFSQAVGLNPVHVGSRFNACQAWMDLGEFQVARGELDELWQLKIGRDLRIACAEMLARCLRMTGDSLGCDEICEEWAKVVSDRLPFDRLAAELQADVCIGRERDGRKLLSLESLEFFEQIANDEVRRTGSDMAYYARWLAWTERVSEARLVLCESAREYPDALEIPMALASLESSEGRWAEAIAAVEAATALDPWLAEVWWLEREVRTNSGDVEGAAVAEARWRYVEEARRGFMGWRPRPEEVLNSLD